MCHKIFSVLILYALSVTSASATTILHMNLDQLTTNAELIVEADVTRVESKKEPNGVIVTFVDLENLEVLQGTFSDSVLTLVHGGGSVDGEVSAPLGLPRLLEGERVILFLQGNGRYIVPIVGWGQGVFRLDTEGAVLDHDGNKITGVDQFGEIEKENRYESEAHYVRLDENSGIQSGYAEKIQIANTPEITTAQQPKTPMGKNAFKNSIQDFVAKQRRAFSSFPSVSEASLSSTELGAAITNAGNSLGGAQASTPPAAISQ